MANTWFISDTHFAHGKIITFRDSDTDEILRPGFVDIDDHDQYIADMWNETIKDGDHVYHLGDVAIRKVGLQRVKTLNGRKRLVRGNHDIFKTREYINAGFKEIHGMRVFENRVVATHAMLHPVSIQRFLGNVHGHIHDNDSPTDGIYVNVSVERLDDYKPIHMDEVVSRMEKQQ